MIRANLKLASNCFIILLVVTKTCNPFLYNMRSKFSRLSLVFAFFSHAYSSASFSVQIYIKINCEGLERRLCRACHVPECPPLRSGTVVIVKLQRNLLIVLF